MIYVFYTIHIVISLFLILVVLLQQGKGADLSVFGGGGTQTVFGARGAATILHKLTVGGFIAFIVTTVAIGLLSTSGMQGSVMTEVPSQEEETAPVAAAPVAPAAVPGDAANAVDEAGGSPAPTEAGESSVEEVGVDEPAGAGADGESTPEPPAEPPQQ